MAHHVLVKHRPKPELSRYCGLLLALVLGAATLTVRADSATGKADWPEVEVAQALMVTVDLDFGANTPGIADALKEIERFHAPEEGEGRTFAILDAYGQRMPDGKLHLSMHLSTEKAGAGWLVFRRTGETLWKSRVVPATKPPASVYAGKGLHILVDDADARGWVLDGTRGGTSILDVKLRDKDMKVRDLWPDGAQREVTFFYSSCGCPVKALVSREGERTRRVKDLPVIFPDDPAVAETIARLMKW